MHKNWQQDHNMSANIRMLVPWFVERTTEIALASYLLSFVFGGHEGLGWRDLTLVVWFFYLATGYIVSTLVFGVFKRNADVTCQGTTMVTVFLVHASALLFVFGHFEAQEASRILVFGSCIVALCNLLGSWTIRSLHLLGGSLHGPR
jgi:hypothetical protein